MLTSLRGTAIEEGPAAATISRVLYKRAQRDLSFLSLILVFLSSYLTHYSQAILQVV